MKSLKKYWKYLVTFVFGIVLTVAITPSISFISEFILGYEIHSRTSHPYNHRARLYTFPGFGDQDLTLEIDGETVWHVNDNVPGDLEENISWDETGHILTLELSGEKVLVYDAENQVSKYKKYGF